MSNTDRIRNSKLSDLVLGILVKSADEVISSQTSLDLIYCYSTLYLNGANCGTCEKSLREYYNEIERTGLTMAENYDNIKNRKCKPSWTGNKYVPKAAKHFNSERLTDSEAIDLIRRGILLTSDFAILPDGIEVEKTEPKQENNINIQLVQPKVIRKRAKK